MVVFEEIVSPLKTFPLDVYPIDNQYTALELIVLFVNVLASVVSKAIQMVLLVIILLVIELC